MIPGWWGFLLLFLAGWRSWHLLAKDDILNGPRNRLCGLRWNATSRQGGRQKLMEWLECPFCSGWWVVLVWWAFWYVWPHWTLVVAVPVALGAGVVAAHKYLTSA